MTVLKAEGVAAFLRKPGAIGLLIHGSDEGKISVLGKSAVKAITGSLDDAFLVARLEDDGLVSDPGRLADELLSIPMFGGRRAIVIEDAGAGFAKALDALGDQARSDNMFVALAENLPKTNALRLRCEGDERIGSIVCYEDGAEDIRSFAAHAISVAGKSIDGDGMEVLAGLLGGGRRSAESEIEKLLSYCGGNRAITADDVLAACAATGEGEVNTLIDAVFDGRMADADAAYATLISSGESPDRLAAALSQHALRLLELQQEVSHGRPADQVVKQARPPIFFRRHAAVLSQMRRWRPEDLERAASSLNAAIFSCRDFPALDAEIASRALLSAARAARAN